MATKKQARSGAAKRSVHLMGGAALRGIAPMKRVSVPTASTGEPQSSLEGRLDKSDATALVFSCTGTSVVDTGATLGELFPSDERRNGFCGAVFNKAAAAGVRLSPASIPGDKTNTLEDVIDSISC
jgi:hypothetical protein